MWFSNLMKKYHKSQGDVQPLSVALSAQVANLNDPLIAGDSAPIIFGKDRVKEPGVDSFSFKAYS